MLIFIEFGEMCSESSSTNTKYTNRQIDKQSMNFLHRDCLSARHGKNEGIDEKLRLADDIAFI